MSATTTSNSGPHAVPTGAFAVTVYSDISCPWANIAVHRLSRVLTELGLEDEISIDHRSFPLELLNDRPTPDDLLNAEIPTCAELEPDAPWPTSQGPWRFAESTLPAMEVVQAAKEQTVTLSVKLDAALRRAFFEGTRLSAIPAVMDVARDIEDIDVDGLWETIRAGRARHEIWTQLDESADDRISASPTIQLADGSIFINPGIEMHWDDHPGGHLVIDRDESSIYDEIIETLVVNRPSD